ncbi:MAG: hypothetical protein EBU88_14245 [Acidobacteria bacterium]|nr:hypothetical protein [Acidobacteriota bacterium]
MDLAPEILAFAVWIEVDTLEIRKGTALLSQESLQNLLQAHPELTKEWAGKLPAAKPLAPSRKQIAADPRSH